MLRPLTYKTRENSRTRQDVANGRCQCCMACSPSPDPRPGERKRAIAAKRCTARLRACAYASEHSFYLISAAAATLSRRLARATFYSLLPSRSGCAPLSPYPRVALARTRILRLFHFICFTPSSLAFFTPALFYLFIFFPCATPVPPLLILSSVSFFISSSCHIHLFRRSCFFFPSMSFPLYLFCLRSFLRTLRLSTTQVSRSHR